MEQAKRLSEDIMAERIKVNGVVDFSIGLVNSVDNLPDRQVKFLRKFKLQNCNQSCWLISWGGGVAGGGGS